MMALLALTYILPNLLYVAPETILSYVVVPIGKSVYTKVKNYIFQKEDTSEHDEFFNKLKTNNLRIYEVISFEGASGNVDRKYILMT